jgi:hypothetical protein
VILLTGTILMARLKAAAAGMDRDAQYRRGHKLDSATAKLLPDTAIGRLLGPDEVSKLLRKVERRIAKQPKAPCAVLTGTLVWTLFAIVGLFMYRYGTIDILEIYRNLVGH